jgi:hypothetical protein
MSEATQVGLPPLFDVANTLLDTGVRTIMVTGLVPLPDGTCGFLTIRCGNTTLSVPIKDREEAQGWVDAMTALRDSFSESGLTVARQPGLVKAVPGQVQ